MKKYPKEYLEEIKLRTKVSSVVGKMVQLKKRGKEFIGLSPFKNEKTPSFTVNDEKGFYHCFSSGEHGNIFDFLMKTKSLGFGEAVKTLALEAGMQPYRFSKVDEEREKRFKSYKKIFQFFSEHFHNKLFENENKSALDYLKKRKLDLDIIKKFKIGFVPWKCNFHETLKKTFSEEEINSTSLFYKNEKSGKYINRFNSRIIFPINNLSGETIGFGGRIINKDSKLAKYINSPETEFYKKGRTIFNLDKAKNLRSATDEVIVVEGYMDVLSLFNFGIKNVVSNSGTAITENQINLVWKFFPNPTICLDGDDSGQKAALRVAERLIPLINENNKIYFSILPKGQDPDDFIRTYGNEKFLSLISSKKMIQNFIWDSFQKNLDKNDPFEISKFEKKIRIIFSAIKDNTLKKYILEEFLNKIKNLTPIQNTRNNFFNKNFKKNQILSETAKLHREKKHISREELKEYNILFIMLNFPQVAQLKIEQLSEVKFSTAKSEKLKNEIIKLLSEDISQNEFKSNLKITFGDKIIEIEKCSNLKSILEKKNDSEKLELLDDHLKELEEMDRMKKIEFLENKIVKNLDENSFSELIKLKSQLNRD